MKRIFVPFLTMSFIILVGCATSKPFPGFYGLKPGMSFSEYLKVVKKNKFYLHSGKSFTIKICGQFASVNPIFKGSKLEAIDVWFGYKDRPEEARDIVFKIKECLIDMYGTPITRTISHPNFTVVQYYWRFKDADIYVGTRIKHFKVYPRILIVGK